MSPINPMPNTPDQHQAAENMPPRLINVKQLSAYLSMPVATIYTYVHTKKIPDSCIKRIGRALRFDVGQVNVWINGISAAQPTALGHKQSAH